jgi:hypothetical protein
MEKPVTNSVGIVKEAINHCSLGGDEEMRGLGPYDVINFQRITN